MNHRIQIRRQYLLVMLLILIFGCSSTQHAADIVRNILNDYQVGRTTLFDLKKDSGMAKVGVPATDAFPSKTYLNPMPDFLKSKDSKTYILPAGSAWKIYELRENFQGLNGQSKVAWTFLIGDTNQSFCYLEFDFDNILSKITPITNCAPSPQPQFNANQTLITDISSAADHTAQMDGAIIQPSTPNDIEVIAETLQKYQCNKTTIQDFVQDAKLINLSHQELNDAVTNSNLPSLILERMVRSSYQIPKGSSWKIYEHGTTSSKQPGNFSFERRWKYVLGDVTKPIFILCFDEEGTLKEKIPVAP